LGPLSSQTYPGPPARRRTGALPPDPSLKARHRHRDGHLGMWLLPHDRLRVTLVAMLLPPGCQDVPDGVRAASIETSGSMSQSCRASSSPRMCGMTSSTTNASNGRCALANRSASGPSDATTTRYPRDRKRTLGRHADTGVIVNDEHARRALWDHGR